VSIINLSDRRKHDSSSGPMIDHDGTILLKMCAPMHMLEELPFVETKPQGWPDGTRREWNCWKDVPTDSGIDDHARGRDYAKMTLAAMETRAADCGGHKLTLSILAIDLEHIIASMIRDGVARHLKGGRHSRTPVTSAMSGFLHELTRCIAGIRD
jgi:hypothetical protein